MSKEEVAVLEGILVVRPRTRTCILSLSRWQRCFSRRHPTNSFVPPAGPESHDLLEKERTETSVSDVAEAAFSLGLLAEFAVTAESEEVRVCRSVTTSYWLCWMPGGSFSYVLTSVEHVPTGVWLLDTSPCGPPEPYSKPGLLPDLQRLAMWAETLSKSLSPVDIAWDTRAMSFCCRRNTPPAWIGFNHFTSRPKCMPWSRDPAVTIGDPTEISVKYGYALSSISISMSVLVMDTRLASVKERVLVSVPPTDPVSNGDFLQCHYKLTWCCSRNGFIVFLDHENPGIDLIYNVVSFIF